MSIEDAAMTDTIASVKQRLFALNRKLPMRRQRIVYNAGQSGIEPLADSVTLGGAGVIRDGSAKLDVLIADLTEAEQAELDLELLEAIKHGRVDDIRGLVNEGANIECRDEYRDTVLMRSVRSGHSECLQLLLEVGSDKDARNNGETAMTLAARVDDYECVRLLLDAGADKEANADCDYGALMCAASFGSSDCLLLLLEAGGNMEARDQFGQTALMKATMHSFPRCVRLLLEAGADPNAQDFDGNAALTLSLVRSPDNSSKRNRIECMRLLLERGANANSRNHLGYAMLTSAAVCDQTEDLRLLLQNGADVNATDRNDGMTALMCAASLGHTDSVRFLLESGADKDIKDCQGLTAMAYARRRHSQSVISLLLGNQKATMSANYASSCTRIFFGSRSKK